MSVEKYLYAVRSELIEGAIRYFTAFVDGTGAICEAEIPQEVYLVLEECRRDEHRQQRSKRRHLERLSLTEAQLAARGASSSSMEDDVNSALLMQAALETLSDAQRRRLLLYYEHGLSIAEIAKAENRNKSTIIESISVATKKFKFFLKQPQQTGG